MKLCIRLPLLLLAALALAGCSQRAATLMETLKVATLGYQDVELTPGQVAALPYATAAIRYGEGPLVTATLALAEGDELKWVTQDRVMFVTRHGRLVKTVGLRQDLAYTGNLEQDPLPALATATPLQARWSTTQDWQPGNYSGYPLLSRFERRPPQAMDLNGRTLRADYFVEQLTYPRLGMRLQNHYWLDPHSGAVLKTRQHLGPGLPVVDITFIKPYTP